MQSGAADERAANYVRASESVSIGGPDASGPTTKIEF